MAGSHGRSGASKMSMVSGNTRGTSLSRRVTRLTGSICTMTTRHRKYECLYAMKAIVCEVGCMRLYAVLQDLSVDKYAFKFQSCQIPEHPHTHAHTRTHTHTMFVSSLSVTS